ncbi:prepilin peptidase [Actinokineospora soli]|uniref:Prepilin peptidase n=1 Tax=Actinokineospora soli TaxID=1048753 RepID=A0ABW2TSB0_9PSEU
MVAVLLVFAGLLGLAVGSFLTVVAHRVPRGESVVRPSSRCPECGEPVRARHNVPVLGWLVLRGRCAGCGAPISARYPLVEAGTGVLFVVLAWRLHALGLLPALPAYLYFGAVAVALSLIDLEFRRLPNAIVVPSAVVLAVLLAVAAGVGGDWWALGRAGIGAAALFGFYAALAVLYPAGMGWGDVKTAGLIGGVLGFLSWSALIVGGFAGFVVGALVGVAVLAAGRGGRKTAIPFGPSMLAGALIGILAGDELGGLYTDLLLGG